MANTPIVIEQEGRPLTTSRAVAEQFGKRHADVLRDIETIKQNIAPQTLEANADLRSPIDDKSINANLRSLTEEEQSNLHRSVEIDPASIEFFNQNFQLSSYIDTRGREQAMYLMSKNGFTLLVMGYTGAKAMQFKISYINAFDRMETMLKTGVSSIALQNIEKRLEALESTAGEGKHDADGAVGHSFLQAIKTALDSGEYYLKPKYGRLSYGGENAECLGYYDEFTITMKSMMAYTIYSKSTKNPLKIRTIWDLLSSQGLIKARDNNKDKIKRFDGKECKVLVIYRNKAPMLKCGHEASL